MKVLVMYDSYFGNTERVAQAVASVFGNPPDVEVRKVDQVQPSQLSGLGWLILGSPTRGFRPSDATARFLAAIPTDGLAGVHAAVFDTRIPESKMLGFLRFIVKYTGYAAEKMASALEKRGAKVVAQPGRFYVLASEGPLMDGELGRAAEWARGLKVE